MNMTLKQLMTAAGTDPDSIRTMSESQLTAYLSPLFPKTRPSAERSAIVAKKESAKKQADILKALDAFDKLQGKLKL